MIWIVVVVVVVVMRFPVKWPQIDRAFSTHLLSNRFNDLVRSINDQTLPD